jgi:hypothetical protein
MKQINSSFSSVLMLVVCLFSIQSILAVDVPLKKGDPGDGTYVMTRAMSRSISLIQVSATLNAPELAIDFTNSVGIANVIIEDQYGMIVYQASIDTNSTLETIIETGEWNNGNYSLHVSYGSTNLVGTFQL